MYSCLLGRDSTLLRDVNSVKELTQILLSDISALLDLCRGETHVRNIISQQLDLILHVSTADVANAIEEFHLAHPFLSQEVPDFNVLAGEGHVDGEMGVHEAHFVQEAASDANEHVVNVRAH